MGTGFHDELTGRENVFLNGTLLGRSRREITERFDEIAAFADIGDFVEAPMRTYSTGMIARLGFAVATAWTPEILILDEVLSVGDEAFQHKCLERMRGFREQGTTVVMVSHSASVVNGMCSRAAWLEHGEVRALGVVTEVTAAYHEFTHVDTP